MSLDEQFFPVGYLKAAQSVWEERARSFLAGHQSAVLLARERSVVAGKAWLASVGVMKVFLSEPGLRNTFRAVGHNGKAVDLVAEGLSKGLILVEAKSVLDAAQLRRSFRGVNKFESTVKALRLFYCKGREVFPGVEKLVITARQIHISTRSRWTVREDGRLLRDGLEVIVDGLPVMVCVIPF